MQASTSSGAARLDTARCPLYERIFLEHPRSLGESYWHHQRVALKIGVLMIAGGVACVIHALVPMLFERTGSNTIRRLHEYLMVTRRIGRVGSE